MNRESEFCLLAQDTELAKYGGYWLAQAATRRDRKEEKPFLVRLLLGKKEIKYFRRHVGTHSTYTRNIYSCCYCVGVKGELLRGY